jgi:hypothetical protein
MSSSPVSSVCPQAFWVLMIPLSYCVDWLGDRDSNPDSMVQSHVSYRWTISQQDAEGTV